MLGVCEPGSHTHPMATRNDSTRRPPPHPHAFRHAPEPEEEVHGGLVTDLGQLSAQFLTGLLRLREGGRHGGSPVTPVPERVPVVRTTYAIQRNSRVSVQLH